MDTRKIIEFIENDTRTQSEIFNSIKNRIKHRGNSSLSEQEAIEATRRFIGYFEVIVDNPRADFSE